MHADLNAYCFACGLTRRALCEGRTIAFQTSKPVSGEAFFDREEELRNLEESVEDTRRGTPRYHAILGPRKIGKSSLLAELKRRSGSLKDVVIVVVDCSESAVDARIFFEDAIAGVVDEVLLQSGRAPRSELLAGSREDDLRLGAAVGKIQALGIPGLSAACSNLVGLRNGTGNLRERFRAATDVPDTLASNSLRSLPPDQTRRVPRRSLRTRSSSD